MSARDALARIRARYEDTHMPPRGRGVGAFSMLQPEFEALIAVVEEVLAMHWRDTYSDCGRCHVAYPCATVTAIETALEPR